MIKNTPKNQSHTNIISAQNIILMQQYFNSQPKPILYIISECLQHPDMSSAFAPSTLSRTSPYPIIQSKLISSQPHTLTDVYTISNKYTKPRTIRKHRDVHLIVCQENMLHDKKHIFQFPQLSALRFHLIIIVQRIDFEEIFDCIPFKPPFHPPSSSPCYALQQVHITHV